MKDSLYTLFYAAAMATVCALLLASVGQFTAPYRQANAKAEEVRNILAVLQVPFEPRASSQELVEIFEKNIREQERGNLTLYVLTSEEGTEEAVAVPFAGTGLWGPIKGFLALEADMRTIRGVTFYEQEETPGLGGEIAAPRFRNQFKGKVIEDETGAPGIRILRGGGTLKQNEVDAITGATMTSERVEQMINAAIEQVLKDRVEHVQ